MIRLQSMDGHVVQKLVTPDDLVDRFSLESPNLDKGAAVAWESL